MVVENISKTAINIYLELNNNISMLYLTHTATPNSGACLVLNTASCPQFRKVAFFLRLKSPLHRRFGVTVQLSVALQIVKVGIRIVITCSTE